MGGEFSFEVDVVVSLLVLICWIILVILDKFFDWLRVIGFCFWVWLLFRIESVWLVWDVGKVVLVVVWVWVMIFDGFVWWGCRVVGIIIVLFVFNIVLIFINIRFSVWLENLYIYFGKYVVFGM